MTTVTERAVVRHMRAAARWATLGLALACFAAIGPIAVPAGAAPVANAKAKRSAEKRLRNHPRGTLPPKNPGIQPAALRLRSLPTPPVVRRREVAVTFDDLPAPSDSVVSYTPEALRAMTARLLAELKQYHVPAIGFVNEEKLDRGNFSQRVDLLKMWLNAGFQLGNHTYSHPDLDSMPLASYELDFLRGEEVTDSLLLARGTRERYFRYPFLDVGKTAATARAFEQFLKRQGYTVAPVTINNQEYMFAAVYAHAMAMGDTATADRVVASFLSYMNGVFAYAEKFSRETLGYEPRQVLLLHADELDTDELGALVRLMRGRGYRFISLQDALRDPAYRLPDDYDDAMDGGVSWVEHWAFTMHKSIPTGPNPPPYVQTAYNKLQ